MPLEHPWRYPSPHGRQHRSVRPYPAMSLLPLISMRLPPRAPPLSRGSLRPRQLLSFPRLLDRIASLGMAPGPLTCAASRDRLRDEGQALPSLLARNDVAAVSSCQV